MSQQSYGKITDEGIARMKERIGVLVPQKEPFNLEASLDGMRHFAYGYGDENPLYCDDSYGRSTPWESQISAPMFVFTMGVSDIREMRPEIRARGAHALAGVHEFFAGDEWEWLQPIRAGDRMTKRYYLASVEEKASSRMAAGRSVLIKYRADYSNQRGQAVAVGRFSFVRLERDQARKAGKNTSVALPGWTDEDLERIDASYANQAAPRGASVRFWEDVKVGEQLPVLTKGPLAVTDVIVWMRGWGGGVATGHMGWKHRRRAPGFFNKNALGAWDVVERVHWDDAAAKSIGNPAAYDFGRMRSAYLSHVVTNWMGDNAWLWKMRSEYRKFNFVGDLTQAGGTVVAKKVFEGRHVVDIEVWCENQRAERTAAGAVTVILPSRESPEVRLPERAQAADDVPLVV